jgi:hypothetical protein
VAQNELPAVTNADDAAHDATLIDVTEAAADAPAAASAPVHEAPLADRAALEQLLGPPLGAIIADFVAPRLLMSQTGAALSGVLRVGTTEYTLRGGATDRGVQIAGPTEVTEVALETADTATVRASSGASARFQLAPVRSPDATVREALPGLQQWTIASGAPLPAAWFAVTADKPAPDAVPQPPERPDIPNDAPLGIAGWRITNEDSTQFALPPLRGHAYLGVGSTQNYDHLTAMRADRVYLVDVDSSVSADHRSLLALVGAARSPQEFVSMLAGVPLTEAERDLPLPELVGTLRRRPRDREYMAATAARVPPEVRPDVARLLLIGQDYFLGHWQKQMAAGQHGWLTDASRFTHLQTLQNSGRITVCNGDMTGQQTMQAIGRQLQASQERLGAIYLSNAEEWLGKLSGKEAGVAGWAANVQHLPDASDAVVLRTVNHKDDRGNTNWVFQTVPFNAYRQLLADGQLVSEAAAQPACDTLRGASQQLDAASRQQWRDLLMSRGWTVEDENKVRDSAGHVFKPRTPQEMSLCLALALEGENSTAIRHTVEAVDALARHGLTLSTDAIQTHAELQAHPLELRRGSHVELELHSLRELRDVAAVYAEQPDAMSEPTRRAVEALSALAERQVRFSQRGTAEPATSGVPRALSWLWRGTLQAQLPLCAVHDIADPDALAALAAAAPQAIERARTEFEALRQEARLLRQSGVNFDFSPAARAATPMAAHLVLAGSTQPVVFDSLAEMRTVSQLQQGHDEVGFLEPMRSLHERGWRFATKNGDISAWPGLIWLALRRGQLQLSRPQQNVHYDAVSAWYLLSTKAEQPPPLDEKQRERYGLFDGLMKAGVVFELPGEHGPTRLSSLEALLQPHDITLAAHLPRRMAFNLWRTKNLTVSDDDGLRLLAKRLHVAASDGGEARAAPPLETRPGPPVSPPGSPRAAPAPELPAAGPAPAAAPLSGEIAGTRQKMAAAFMGERDGQWVDEKSPVAKNSFSWWSQHAPEPAQRQLASTMSSILANCAFSNSIVRLAECGMQALSHGGFDTTAGMASLLLGCYDAAVDDTRKSDGEFKADTHFLNTTGLEAVKAKASGDAKQWLTLASTIAPNQYFASSRRGVIKLALRAVADERPWNAATLGQMLLDMLDASSNVNDASGTFHADAMHVEKAGLEYCRGLTEGDTRRWLQMANVMLGSLHYASSAKEVTRAALEAMRDARPFNERTLAAVLAQAVAGCSDRYGADKQWHSDTHQLLEAVMPTVDSWMTKAETRAVLAEFKKFRASFSYSSSIADAARMCFDAIARGTDEHTMGDLRDAFVAAATTDDRARVAGL